MKNYFSLDIETGGLYPHSALLEFGMVFDNGKSPIDELPSFRAVILPELRERENGEAFFRWWNGEWSDGALSIHQQSGLYDELIQAEVDNQVYFDSRKSAFIAAEEWMTEVSGRSRKTSHRLAGKNLAVFDLPVLRAHGWCLKYKHRVLDVGTLFLPHSSDGWIPTLSQCLSIAGIENESVTHYAIDDARAVLAAIRWAMNKPTV